MAQVLMYVLYSYISKKAYWQEIKSSEYGRQVTD